MSIKYLNVANYWAHQRVEDTASDFKALQYYWEINNLKQIETILKRI